MLGIFPVPLPGATSSINLLLALPKCTSDYEEQLPDGACWSYLNLQAAQLLSLPALWQAKEETPICLLV